MTEPVRLERTSGLAVIVIDNPPVNALGAAVRQRLAKAMAEAVADDTVTAIVLTADGRTFPAGADIAEFGQPVVAPSLPDLCNQIEASPKPVLAALHGTVLGGGLELAMAAHFRVAHEAAQLGLPEITLGLIPGAGGTQRTPRLIGVEAALELMLSGLPISAQEAHELGLVDGVAGDDLRDIVIMLAKETPSVNPASKKRQHMMDGTEYMAQIALWRAELGDELAPNKIVDCVEAALLLPFEGGMDLEREAFAECLASPVSAGLRHAFFAERRVAKFPELKDSHARPVDHIGILGGRVAGAALACACLDAGFPVTVLERGQAGTTQALERIGRHYQREAAAGRVSQQKGAEALDRLTLTDDPAKMGSADFVLDCMPEDTARKTQMLRNLDAVLKPGAIYAANTPDQDVEALAHVAGRPADTLIFHMTGPGAKLAEIGVLRHTAPDVVVTAHALARALRKVPVRCAAEPDLVANTLLHAYREACDRLLLRGALPNQVDGALRKFGMVIGPYEMLDHTGLHIAHMRRKSRSTPKALMLLDRMAEAGWLGRKSGQGYYVYDFEGGAGMLNPKMVQLLEAERQQRRVELEAISDADICTEVVLALIAAGAGLVERGVVQRPSDIDAVMIHGLGYPRARGGPMHEGDQMGTFDVARRIDKLAEKDPKGWRVAPVLRKLAAERHRFSDLNAV